MLARRIFPDSKIAKMIKRAEVTLELEMGKEVDYNCSDAEKEFITILAAIYVICYLTGDSAVSLSFSSISHLQYNNMLGKLHRCCQQFSSLRLRCCDCWNPI
ncbi:hypothetical protein H5T51_05470 [Candidatus Bathyarchaeota archaeon]|nr:hypothetical protein [Candidatus Bathyarchaeota archaeon]